MDSFDVKVIVDPRRLKRIKITCRCGNVAVYTIADVDGIIPVVECSKCQQNYMVGDGKIVRCDKDLSPEKVIELQQEFSTEPSPDAWDAPGSKLVN